MDEPRYFGATLLVSGSEGLLAERATAAWIQRARQQRPDAALSRLSAVQLEAATLIEAAGASLLADSAIVVVDDLPSLTPETAEALISLVSDPGPDLALVVLHPGGVKGKAVLDRIRKLGPQLAECLPLKAWELPQFVTNEARIAKGRVESAAALALIEAVGSDLRSLAAAVRQLLADTSDNLVTAAAVRRYFAGRAEVTSFAVADDLLAGNAEGALGKLRWALSTGVAPVLVTSATSSALRNLGKYLGLRSEGLREADLARQVGVPPWKVKDLARQARHWNPTGVAAAIQVAATADAQVKGAASDPGFALEQMVLAVLAARSR